jgi:hypothetical protein
VAARLTKAGRAALRADPPKPASHGHAGPHHPDRPQGAVGGAGPDPGTTMPGYPSGTVVTAAVLVPDTDVVASRLAIRILGRLKLDGPGGPVRLGVWGSRVGPSV